MNPEPKTMEMQSPEGFRPITIEEEAARILKSASQEAQEILARAQQDAQHAQAAKANAQLDNQQERKQLSQLAQALNSLLGKLEEQQRQFTLEAEGYVLKLALGIAELLIGKEIQDSDAVLRHALSRAVQRALPEQVWKVVLNPADLEAAKRLLPELLKTRPGQSKVILSPSEQVSPGGCLLRTHNLEIDATLQTQLAEIKRHLLGEVRVVTTDTEPDPLREVEKEVMTDVYYSG